MADAPGLPTKRKSGPNRSKWDRVALLVASDELSQREIAKEAHIARSTLQGWLDEPEFNALVGGYRGQIIADALKLPIAKKHKRVAVLDDLHSKALAVIEDRGKRNAEELAELESAVMATRRIFGTDTPSEAATGLLVKQETANNAGMRTVNWSVDTGLLKEIRALQEQAAKELGQWEDTVNLNHSGVNRTYTLEDD